MPCVSADVQAALPPVKASITISGNCNDAIYGGRCLIDAKALGELSLICAWFVCVPLSPVLHGLGG